MLEKHVDELVNCTGGTIFHYNGFSLNKLSTPNDDSYQSDVIKYMSANKLLEYVWNKNMDQTTSYSELEITEKIIDQRGNIILVAMI